MNRYTIKYAFPRILGMSFSALAAYHAAADYLMGMSTLEAALDSERFATQTLTCKENHPESDERISGLSTSRRRA